MGPIGGLLHLLDVVVNFFQAMLALSPIPL
jgi:hypothetical protein